MPKEPKEPLTFSEAPEVESVARRLIEVHHQHLRNKEIRYVFRSEPEVIRGSEALASASKVSGLKAFLADSTDDSLGNLTDDMEDAKIPKPFFLMQVWAFGWMQLDAAQQEACVDHELCHFGVDDGKLCIIPHDLEEFQAVVERHGLWRPKLEEFVKAAERCKDGQQSIEDAGHTLTIEHGGKSATFTTKQLETAAKRISELAKGAADAKLAKDIRRREVVDACMALGYGREAAEAAYDAVGAKGKVQDAIRAVLRRLTP